ncbi:HPP family protein [Lysinibacillus sp. KU-BSD001]|uniref:HPP family protein n=1 Tax=Lysinibacillus sp. KU-BSD001 TaxID=3141328 RepID=UPI0036F0B90E
MSWWYEYFRKMLGQHQQVNHQTNIADALTGAVGGCIGIGTLLFLTQLTHTSWLMASLGASCVLVFGAWNAPFSQPRNVIGGHLLSGIIGISFYMLFGSHPLAISVAVGFTIFAMMLTRTVHPPAGGNPIIIMLGGYSWPYLVAPVIIGAVVIVIYAVLINNIRQKRHYPLYWW